MHDRACAWHEADSATRPAATLKWLGAKKASATFAGMKPFDVDVTTTEGTTRFVFEGKPYFWVSDRRAAELELQPPR